MTIKQEGTQPAHAVALVWATPEADALIARMARVSNSANEDNTATAPRLIAYLIRHKHWSPFEMASLCVEIRTTRDIGRQLLRHRSLSFQEFSQRYAAVDLSQGAWTAREARRQHPTNRQASLPVEPGLAADWWASAQADIASEAWRTYQAALRAGIAKEVARAILPEGLTPTRLYAAGTIRSWLHFCEVRRGHGTQPEAIAIADAIWAILQDTCPQVAAAWEMAHPATPATQEPVA